MSGIINIGKVGSEYFKGSIGKIDISTGEVTDQEVSQEYTYEKSFYHSDRSMYEGIGFMIIEDTFIVGGEGFSSEYQAIYDQFSTKPDSADAAAQDTFVSTLVDEGVWSELDRLFIFASHASGTDSLLDWVHPTEAGNVATLVNAPSFVSKQGYTGDGSTSYINTNFAQTDGVNYQRDSASVLTYTRTELNGSYGIVGINNSSEQLRLLPRNSGFQFLYFHDTSAKLSTIPSSLGLHAGERINSATIEAFKDGVSLGTASNTSDPIGANDMFALAIRDSSGSPSLLYPGEVSLISFGASLGATKQLALYNAFQALMTHYGTQV
jgi:hypothetical protein